MIKLLKFFTICFIVPSLVLAMTSQNFSVDQDVFGDSGGTASSANYSTDFTTGEAVIGFASSTNYGTNMGFWNITNYAISMSCPSSMAMAGITGYGKSDLTNNFVDCTIVTDNPAGYTLLVSASTTNMKNANGDTIGPYTPVTPLYPETWSVASNASEWGAKLGSNSTTYDITDWGSNDTYSGGKWHNASTSYLSFISRTSATTLLGDDEYIYFGAEVGAEKLQPSGTYSVDIILTAVTL